MATMERKSRKSTTASSSGRKHEKCGIETSDEDDDESTAEMDAADDEDSQCDVLMTTTV